MVLRLKHPVSWDIRCPWGRGLLWDLLGCARTQIRLVRYGMALSGPIVPLTRRRPIDPYRCQFPPPAVLPVPPRLGRQMKEVLSLSNETQFVPFDHVSENLLVQGTVKLQQLTQAFDYSSKAVCFEGDLFQRIRQDVQDSNQPYK